MKHYLQCLVYLQWLANNSWSDTVSAVPVVQSPSCVRLFATPWTSARQASLSLTISRSLPKFMSVGLVTSSNHFRLCCPLLLLPLIFPSIRVFSNESVLHIRWPKYRSFGFSISSFSEYSGLISFRIQFSLLEGERSHAIETSCSS